MVKLGFITSYPMSRNLIKLRETVLSFGNSMIINDVGLASVLLNLYTLVRYWKNTSKFFSSFVMFYATLHAKTRLIFQ